MKNKVKLLFLGLGLSAILVACGGNNNPQATEPGTQTQSQTETMQASNETEGLPMHYISGEETRDIIDDGRADDYILIDLRGSGDYQDFHVDRFSNADLNRALSEDDREDGVKRLKNAIDEQTDGEGIGDREVILMCYSGNRYARMGTDLLVNELGVDEDQIRTIRGGMKGCRHHFRGR